MERKDYYLWLSSLSCYSNTEKRKMLQGAGDIEELYQFNAEDLFALGISPNLFQMQEYTDKKNVEQIQQMKETLNQKNMRYISMEDAEYPDKLHNLSEPPIGLFVKGELPPEDGKCVSIVGARSCSAYGREMARFFAGTLAEHGCHIISGMAMGIDGQAERSVLEAGFPAYSVLAGGADSCYPMSNIDIYTMCQFSGGIISEMPPGYHARSKDFPIRNRIIAALSDTVLVIEAAVRSGSLITVNDALDLGIDVFSLPGRVGDYLSGGCNELIKNGAHCLTCPEDVLQFLGIDVAKETEKRQIRKLTKEEKIVFDFLSRTPVNVDTLMEKTGIPLSEILRILLSLEMKGAIRKTDLSGYVIV